LIKPAAPERDMVVIGASMGGVEALTNVVRGLPEALPAAVLIVLHTGAAGPGRLAEILSRSGALVAEEALDGMQIRHGRIYVAPPDRHLLVLDGQIAVERGPKENGFRPAVDTLFRTAAATYGDRVVGVILTGGLDDGTLGLKAIKGRGGAVIVQDPEEALAKGMPTSAIRGVEVDLILRSREIGPAIARLVETGSKRGVKPDRERGSIAMKRLVPSGAAPRKIKGEAEARRALPGPPSIYTCPDCGGTMWEIKDGDLYSFRCHVGHAYGPETLLFHQDGKLEDALWTAVRLMEENAAFRVRMAQRAREVKLDSLAGQHEQQSSLLRKRAEVIRSLLRKHTLRDLAASPAGRERPNKRRKTARRAAGKVHSP